LQEQYHDAPLTHHLRRPYRYLGHCLDLGSLRQRRIGKWRTVVRALILTQAKKILL
jgi:hypothetical protein